MYVIHVVELFYVSPRYSACFFLTQNLSGDEKNSPMAWSPLKLISPLAKKYMAMLHAARENSITGSQKNIQASWSWKNSLIRRVSTVVMNEHMTVMAYWETVRQLSVETWDASEVSCGI